MSFRIVVPTSSTQQLHIQAHPTGTREVLTDKTTLARALYASLPIGAVSSSVTILAEGHSTLDFSQQFVPLSGTVVTVLE